MRPQKGNVSIVVLIVILTVVGVFIAQKPQQTGSSSVSPISALASVPKEAEVKNLDGSRKLIMQEEKSNEGTTYTFFVSDGDGNNRRVLFSKTGGAMSIPPNSWAPDNTYVFIKQTEPTTTFFVFKVSGESFAAGDQYLDVASLFATKQPELVFKEVTGWDGVGLIHVTSTTAQGAKGPSFWFDVASKSFLQLY